MRSAVTGASGVFGRGIAARLRSEGHEIVSLARHQPRNRFSDSDFVEAYIRDAASVYRAVNGADVVADVSYTGGGETWVWEAGPGDRCPVRNDLLPGHRWRQGWAHHVDEQRRPKITEALMETYNGRLLQTCALREKVAN
ncbi:MAG: NAD-dependent epimerase/dehydratase family protein [Mycobacterium sp.]